MKLSTKAALFSALIFPGSGYFIVGQKLKGALCLSAILVALVLFMMEAFYKAQLIAQKIVSGHISYEIAVIREEIIHTPGRFDATIIGYVSWLVVALWLVSIVDAYRIGRSMELRGFADRESSGSSNH